MAKVKNDCTLEFDDGDKFVCIGYGVPQQGNWFVDEDGDLAECLVDQSRQYIGGVGAFRLLYRKIESPKPDTVDMHKYLIGVKGTGEYREIVCTEAFVRTIEDIDDVYDLGPELTYHLDWLVPVDVYAILK